MSAPAPPPAPLEADDPARARALRAKVRTRMTDVRRHLRALRTAMAEFGEDFDADTFAAAHASEDPIQLNRVKAVERGVDQLCNFIAELAAVGTELAALRGRNDDATARKDLAALRHAGVLSAELTRRLQRLTVLHRMLRANTTADHVQESALLAAADFPAFYEAYRSWIAQGFDPGPKAARGSSVKRRR
jgi:hypothetical protein